MAGKSSTRQAHLEALFGRYPDLPFEAIVKEDILTEGVAISPALANGNLAKDLAIEGGLYNLRRTIVRARVRQESPYVLDSAEDGWVIIERSTGSALMNARRFPVNNGYAERTGSDGTLFGDILSPDGELEAFPACRLSNEDRCKFCSLGLTSARISRSNGLAAASARGLAQVAEAVGELFVGTEWDPREGPINVKLTGGSIVGKVEGKTEEEFYLQYVAAVKSVIRNRYPLLLEMFPKPSSVEAHLRRQGVNGRLSNLDIWDKQLFSALCPGKERWIGWEEWIHRLIDQVDVYGQGHVLPGLIIGLEMVGPWGNKSLKETVKNTSKAFDFLMLHGITPRPVHIWFDPLSALGGKEQPPVDLFLEVDRAWYETWQKYSMFEPVGYRMGPGRTRFSESAAFDIGRGSPLPAKEDCQEPRGGLVEC